MPSLSSSFQHGFVIYAKNKKRVSAFYRRTLGLSLVEEESTHDVLRGPGVEIVVHAIPPQYAAEIVIAKPPKPREESAFKPTFVVADLAVVRAAAKATGGFLKPRASAWEWNGMLVLDGWDPEGNVVGFRQPAR